MAVCLSLGDVRKFLFPQRRVAAVSRIAKN